MELININKNKRNVIFKSPSMKITLDRNENWEELKNLDCHEVNLEYPKAFNEFNGVTYKVEDHDTLFGNLYLSFQNEGKVLYYHWTNIGDDMILEYYHRILNLILKCKVYIDKDPVNHNLIEYVASDKSSDLELGIHLRDVGKYVDDVTYYLGTSDFIIRLTDINKFSAFIVKYVRFTGKESTRIARVGISNIMPSYRKSGIKPYRLRDNEQFVYLTNYKIKSLIISNIINTIRLENYENNKTNL